VGKPEGKRPLVRSRQRYEFNIKLKLKKNDEWHKGSGSGGGGARTGLIWLRVGKSDRLL
jgi:hypothetical protein